MATAIPSSSRVCRSPGPLFAIIVLGSAIWTYDAVTADFGNGCVVTSLTVYSELMAQAWEEYGFGHSLGVPMFHCVGETVTAREPYAHQAPMGWWFPSLGRWIFGKGPQGYRFFPALFFAAAAVLLARLVWRRAGAAAAILTSLLLALCPATGLYGALPGIESVAFLATAIFLTVWNREPTRVGPARTLASYLALTPFAWSFAFVAPGVWFGEWLKPKAERRAWLAFGLGFVQVLGVILVLLHLSMGIGSFEHTFGEIFDKSSEVLTQGIANRHETLGTTTTVQFLPAQDAFSKEALGNVGRIALLLALGVAFLTRAGRRDPLTVLGVPFLAQGLLSIVVFNARSNTHGYYWLLTAPAFAIYLVVLVRTLNHYWAQYRSKESDLRDFGRGWSLPFLASSLILVGTLAATDGPRAWKLRAAFEAPGLAEMARGIDSFIPPGDWISSLDTQVIEACLYSERRWTPPLLTPEIIQGVLDARRSGQARFGKLWIQLSPQAELVPAVHDLAQWLRSEASAGRAQRLSLGTLEVFAL